MLGGNLLELLMLGDRLRAEHRIVDVAQQGLALAHALAELKERDSEAAEQISHITYDA